MNGLTLADFTLDFLGIAAIIFTLLVGGGLLWVAILYWSDITQKKHTIRRNYPVIGRFRYYFEYLGEFFRQYFFAQDREELPFNRAQRTWIYRASKNVDATTSFGSTRPLNQPGDFIFLNCLFPSIYEDHVKPSRLTIGAGFAREPFQSQSFFNISGMSYGALSKPAITALASGARKAGIWLNTGEGGVSSYHLDSGCDLVYQIGTAKYGVQDDQKRLSEEKLRQMAAYPQIRMFEIKLSQGAKPGKGGILPGKKVSAEISKIRSIPEGEDSISPNSHVDINNVDQLLEMVKRIRGITGKPCGFKLVLGNSHWLKEFCETIHRRGLAFAPDFITLDSADGGTGAAPQSLIDFMGLPIQSSLPTLTNTLIEYGLKDRIKIIASGKLINPGRAAWALAMGADFVVSARGFMFSLGCIQALQCNKNTCPTGVTTHNKELQKGLDPTEKSERVRHYAENLIKEVGVIAHSCGVDDPRQLSPEHVQIINEHGLPEPVAVRFPTPNIREEYKPAP